MKTREERQAQLRRFDDWLLDLHANHRLRFEAMCLGLAFAIFAAVMIAALWLP